MSEAIELTSSYIKAIAPNAKALANARGIADSFSDMRIDKPNLCLYANCQGNSTLPYGITVCLGSPLRYKCTCPSRQTPCKHVLGLLIKYESNPKLFAECFEGSGFLPVEPHTRSAKSAPSTVAVKRKNALRLRGLHTAKDLCDELIEAGLGRTLSLPVLLDKSSILLAHKLPDVYSRWCAVLYVLLGEERDKNIKALEMLSKYYGALTRAIDYYSARTEDSEFPVDYRIESWLGEAWTFDRLEAMGNIIEDARLIQLSFSVNDNMSAKRIEEVGVWMELNTGELVRTVNLRPYAAITRTNESDSFLDILLTPKLCRYPLGKRARWKSFTCANAAEDDFCTLASHALAGGNELCKTVKRQLLDPLEDSPPIALVHLKSIMSGEGGLVFIDGTDGQIELCDDDACDIIRLLPLEQFCAALLEFVIKDGQTISAHPLCLVGQQGLFRVKS